MNNFLTCLLALATTFSIGFISYSYSSDGIAEAKGFSLMSEYHRAEIDKDRVKLSKLISDDLQSFGNGHLYRFRNGKPISKRKKRLIAFIKSIDTESIITYFARSRFVDGKIVVSFQTIMTARIDDKSPSVFWGELEYTFENRENEWKLVSTNRKN